VYSLMSLVLPLPEQNCEKSTAKIISCSNSHNLLCPNKSVFTVIQLVDGLLSRVSNYRHWNTEVDKYAGAAPCWAFHTSTAVLKAIRWRTGNQCRRARTGVMGSHWLYTMYCIIVNDLSCDWQLSLNEYWLIHSVTKPALKLLPTALHYYPLLMWPLRLLPLLRLCQWLQ